MKILYHSTTPWGPSSYSVLSARVVPEFVRMGHEVLFTSWYGLQGAPQSWPIRPRGEKKATPLGYVQIMPSWTGNNYGVEMIEPAYRWMGADCLITCMDLWVVPAQVLSRVFAAPWLPIDHDPIPQGILDSLRACAYPMVYSEWGTQIARDAGVSAHYVPCSADSETFYPMDRKAARGKIGLDDSCDFLVSMVAANKDPGDRKGFSEALQGFAKFAQSHPNAKLYVHTLWGGPINIGNMVERLGLSGRVMQPDQFGYICGLYNDEYMRAVYAASDVLLNPAKSEGFGLPLVEAQMCGTPIAVTDFSTSRELLSAGWLIDGQKHWSMGADSWRLLCYVDSIVSVLEEAYANRDNEVLRKQARKGAIKYDSAKVADEYWKPALTDIERMACNKGGLQLVTF